MTTLSNHRVRNRLGRFAPFRRTEATIDLVHASLELRTARDKKSLPETLHELAWHEEAAIRAAVAANPSAVARVSTRLMHDPAAEVRAAAASHPDMPAEQLRLMLRDPETAPRDAAVRALLDRGEQLEVDVLEFSSHDD